jgi:anti-sigma factor (TIGR02949 family)
MITCAEAVRQLWEYLDGVVDATEREAIEEHLAFCRRCCGEVEFAEELRRFLAGHAEEEIPQGVHARLQETLEAIVEQR